MATKKTLTQSVFDKEGKSKGRTSMPLELFNAKISEDLMNQAVHIYLANQRRGTRAQKTRSEVTASTRKIYRQKGTGRARHGALTAPIFVGGGVTFAAKPVTHAKKLTKKMRLASLASALTTQKKAESVKILDAKIEGKTKEVATILKNLKSEGKNILFIIDEDNKPARRAAKNIAGITTIQAKDLNTYQVLKAKEIIFLKSALESLKKHFIEKNEK